MAVCTVVAPVGHIYRHIRMYIHHIHNIMYIVNSQIHTSAGGTEDLQDSLLHVTQQLLSSASSQSNEHC